MGFSVESTEWLFSPLFPGRIGIWKCWYNNHASTSHIWITAFLNDFKWKNFNGPALFRVVSILFSQKLDTCYDRKAVPGGLGANIGFPGSSGVQE